MTRVIRLANDAKALEPGSSQCDRNEAGDRSHSSGVIEREGDSIIERCGGCGTELKRRNDPIDTDAGE